MLRAHARIFEHLTLAMDLVLIAACWLGAYALRFYVVGPPMVVSETPPLRGYLLQLVPILLGWGAAFHWFDLYRPRRLGSPVSEGGDVAEASPPWGPGLVAIMT